MNRVVARERLEAETAEVARALAGRPQRALRAAKEAMRRGAGLPLDAALRLEALLAERAARGDQP